MSSIHFLICCGSFRLQLIAIYCNRRGVWTVHLTRHYSSCSEHALIVAHHIAWLKWTRRAGSSQSCWLRQNKLWFRYIHNINSVNDKISNSKEETLITWSISRLDGGTTESHGWPADSIFIFIFNFAVADFAIPNELELMATYTWEMVVISASWKEFQKINGGAQTVHPLTIHICAVQFVHTRGTHKQRAWLKGQHGSRIALSSLCSWKQVWSSGVAQCLTFCCFLTCPFTTSTSSSSFTLPSTTQEQAAQSVQQEQLREHPLRHAHLQAPSVDKLRHQESLWREDLQSGGNPRTTTPTFFVSALVFCVLFCCCVCVCFFLFLCVCVCVFVVFVDNTPHTSLFLMQWTRTHCCTSNCMAQVLVHASLHPHSHPCVRLDRLFSLFIPHLVPLRVFIICLLLLPEPWPVPLPFPCGFHRGDIPLALRQLRSLALWPKTPLSQVMSPTSLTISTTRRLLKSSSRSNPATQCPRTCLTRGSATRPSEIHKHEFQAHHDRRSIQKIEWSYRVSTRWD